MKHYVFNLLLLFLLVIPSSSVFGQVSGQSETNEPKQRNYHTNDYMEWLSNSQISSGFSSANIGISEKEIRENSISNVAVSHELKIIFNVINSPVSQSQMTQYLEDQVDILNNDFASLNTQKRPLNDEEDSFYERRSNTQISFCITASVNRKKGISFKNKFIQQFNDYTSMKTQQFGAVPFQVDKYINIWVCNLPKDNSGFSQMPGYSAQSDGIVIDFDYIIPTANNAPYNLGHSLTHLMGNYLGLYPLWGPQPCSDDYVADTPVHNAPNFNCPSYTHSSACFGQREMTMNFMDNTNDECLDMFTRGQMVRMQTMLSANGLRNSLTLTGGSCRSQSILDEDIAETRNSTSDNSIDQPNIQVNPNPSSGSIYISFEHFKNDLLEYQIYSIAGEIVYRSSFPKVHQPLEINISDWVPGLYTISCATKNGKIVNAKFVVL